MAQYRLGCCYYTGEGVEQDAGEAVKWYHQAAEQGLAEAEFHLGDCYANGWGVTKNRGVAAKWYYKAAAQGEPRAKEALKQMSQP